MVLRQPAGNVLAAMVGSPGGAGTLHPSAPGAAEQFARAKEQIEGWGWARFRAEGDRRWSFRVTALGRAAHGWGWAALHPGGREGDTRVSPRRGAA